MNVRIPQSRLEYLIQEDVPYIDLTVEALKIGDKQGRMTYFTREACMLCGTEEVVRMMKELDVRVVSSKTSGTLLEAGEDFLVCEGSAAALHMAWKACLNVFDHLSAIATKTHSMVSAAHEVNPHCEVLTTRKSMPGVKDLMVKAVMTGGAYPHRLGLSETVLVFGHHISFLGGFNAFLEQIPEIRSRCIEKKFYVEANAEQARILAHYDIDGLQIDKVPACELPELVKELREINPHVTIIATGGVNPSNAAEYAATGVDGLATTALYSAKPLDMSVRMEVL